MRFDKFLEAAGERNAAIVMQVSWANGLDIIRDLSAADVPLLALDANPRALGLHSRLAAGQVCPDPREDEDAFVSWLDDLGPRFARRPVLFPTHDQYIWPISRNAERLEKSFLIPFSRWDTMQRLHDKRAQMEAAWRVGVDTPKTVFVDSDEDLERGAEEIGFPAIFKPVESLAFKVRFRRHVLEIGSREELLRTYDAVRDCGTLMLQDIVPGGDEELYTLGSYLDAQSRPLARVHRAQAAPAPPALRPREHGSERLGARARGGRPAAAPRARLPRRQPGRVQARPARRALPPHGGQRPSLDVAQPGHGLRREPVAGRLPRRRRRPVHRAAPGGRQEVGGRAHRRARRALRLAQAARQKLGPWLRSYRGVSVDGLYSLRDPMPGLLITGRQLKRFVTRTGEPHEKEAP